MTIASHELPLLPSGRSAEQSEAMRGAPTTPETPFIRSSGPPSPRGEKRELAASSETQKPYAIGVGKALILPIIVIGLWEIAVRIGLASGALMPPPSAVLKALWELAKTGELFTHIWTTSLRVLTGFLFGALAGTLLGAATGYFRPLRDLLDPSIQALRSIPSIAWVPLFILWLGIFEASKVTLIAVGVFFPVYLGVSAGIISVDRKLVEVGRIFNLSGAELVRRILLPSMIPGYVVALRNGLGLGWMFVVAAEFMGASQGLGYLLVDGQQLGKSDQILAAILVFAVLGKLSDALIVAISKPFLRWQDNFQPGA